MAEQTDPAPPAGQAPRRVALLTGGTGFVGSALLGQLLDEGWHVIATSSRPRTSPDPRVTWVEADFTKPETHVPAFWRGLIAEYGVTAFVNNAGISEERPEKGLTFENVNVRPVVAMAEAAEEAGARFLQISTRGAGLPEADRYGYTSSNKRAEELLNAMPRLGATIVRPDIVYTPRTWGHDMSMDEVAALPVVPRVGSGQQTLQPIHREDLAKAVRLLDNPEARGRTFEAVGPERLTVTDLTRFLKAQRGESYVAMPVPYAVATAVATAYPLGAMNRDFVEMLRDQDRRGPTPEADPTPFADAVGADRLTTLSEAYGAVPDLRMKASPHAKLLGLMAADPKRVVTLAGELVRQTARSLQEAFRRPSAAGSEATEAAEATARASLAATQGASLAANAPPRQRLGGVA